MKKQILSLLLLAGLVTPAWSATNNSQYPPTFLWLDICTNAIGDVVNGRQVTRMSPTTLDVGVDLGADGTVDKWLSGEKTEYLGRENAASIAPENFRRFLIRLDEHAGKDAKIRIVDNSADYFIAVKAIRLNYADGTVVPNGVPNGFFEEDPALNRWTLLPGGNVTNKAQLLSSDTNAIFYGSKFYSTFVNGNQGTATIESDTFTLTPPSSFIYAMVSGGGSEFWNIPDWQGSDNASGVYIDIGTASQDPNGRYDAGTDIPLTGFFAGSISAVRNQMHPVFINTTGKEGLRAQIVAVDDSEFYHVALDGCRMNWDDQYITNGGFEDIPIEWIGNGTLRDYTEHPSGGIPGWNVSNHDVGGFAGDATIYYNDKTSHGDQHADSTYVGTGGAANDARFFLGVELRSDVFVIKAIPEPSTSVFMQYSGAQGTNRIKENGDKRTSIELQVDVNENGTFGEPGDYTYRETSQGMGWNLNTSNLDLWQYPDYRFYIQEAHYGKPAQIYIEDTLTGGYGWLCADDFFFWDGSKVVQPFPNADFEMGDLTSWTEEFISGSLFTLLCGTPDIIDAEGFTDNIMMNGREGTADGNYAMDTAGGDGTQATLTSVTFTIPTRVTTDISEWSIH